jgi:hypothetical protein
MEKERERTKNDMSTGRWTTVHMEQSMNDSVTSNSVPIVLEMK